MICARQVWLGKTMLHDNPVTHHSNRYHARCACEQCEGILRNEPWCLTVNPSVYYAYKIVVSPEKVTMVDSIILHSLGVLWSDLNG
jgi:hypothetical protein